MYCFCIFFTSFLFFCFSFFLFFTFFYFFNLKSLVRRIDAAPVIARLLEGHQSLAVADSSAVLMLWFFYRSFPFFLFFVFYFFFFLFFCFSKID